VHVSPLKVPRLSVGDLTVTYTQWRRQDFVTGGKVRYGSIGGLEYEVPQSRLYCPCINVALLDGLAMYLSCDTKKFHDNESTHILHNFLTSTHSGEKLPPSPLAAPLLIPTRASVTSLDAPSLRHCYIQPSARDVHLTSVQSGLANGHIAVAASVITGGNECTHPLRVLARRIMNSFSPPERPKVAPPYVTTDAHGSRLKCS